MHESNTAQFTSLAVDKKQPGILYASSESKLYKTTDDGINWNEIDTGLRTILGNTFRINAIQLDDSIAGRFYIGLSNGLYLTEDDGITWRQIHNRDISIIKGDTQVPMNIYFVTNAERTLIRMLDTFTVTGVNNQNNILPEGFSLEQNYPNPFNPTTTIRYQILKNGLVTLKVYDVLGSEVKTLVNSYQSAGEHFVKFDGRGLASGVYFYSLITEDFSQTKKMILLP